MKGIQRLTALVVLCSLSALFECFNFDINEPIFKQVRNGEDDPNSNIHFGFSVAQHIVKSTRTPYVIVGAPKDDMFVNGKFYNASGAIYKCPITLNSIDDCELITVDFETKSSDEVSRNKYLDENLNEQFRGRLFENQWFGVSLSSTGQGAFSACAHKYVHHYNFVKRDEHAAYGACYTFDNEFNQEYKYIPCLLYSHDVNTFYFNNYAYCQAGTSVLMMESPSLVLGNEGTDTFLSIGMPGSLNFRGLVNVKERVKSNTVMEYVYKNQSGLCKFDLETDRPMPGGYCGNLWEKYSYLGMSHVMIQRYLGRDKFNLIAAGSPREDLYGMVRFFSIVYDSSFGPVMRHLNVTLRGPKRGSYFGFSLATLDLNGDRSNDLIVGAPYYSTKFEPNAGAIYIYLNHRTKGFTDEAVLNFTGPVRSMFGHAIASIGDIDKDGYGDFAVGAPYEANPIDESKDISADQRPLGAVYIFRGGPTADKIRLSQKIYAQDVRIKAQFSAFTPSTLSDSNALSLRAFGYSLSGGLDMDGNSYPDLAVGVLNSNAILVLRSRPIVRVNAFVANNNSLQDIDQNKRDCTSKLEANRTAICFDLIVCFELINDSQNPIQASQIDDFSLFKYQLSAAESNVSTSLYSRAYFDLTNTPVLERSLKLRVQRECESVRVLIKNDNEDFLQPVKFALNFTFEGYNVSSYQSIIPSKLKEINKYPVAHEDFNKYEFEVNFKKDCGPDRRCNTDLDLNARFVNLKLGEDNVPVLSFKESDTLSIAISLANTGANAEPAYGTEVYVSFDKRLDFMRQDKTEQNGFKCRLSKKNNFSGLLCKMSEYLGPNANVTFGVTFSAARLYKFPNITREPNLKFEIEAKTLSNDIFPGNNLVKLLARLKVRANLFVYGTRTPEQLFYGDEERGVIGESSMRSLEDIGPIIEHTYTIGNSGPFSVDNFRLIIDWPYETRLLDYRWNSHSQNNNGKHLLYLIEKPTKIPNDHPLEVVCNSFIVDPLKLGENRGPQQSRRRRSSADDSAEDSTPIAELKNETEKTFYKENAIEYINTERSAVIDCTSSPNTAFCYKINCNFYGSFSKHETISIKLTARLWNSTLVEDYSHVEKVLIKSHAKLELNDDIHDERQTDNEISVATLAYSNIVVIVEKETPLWIYLLSVLVGLALFLLSVLGFWMLGFFERQKLAGADDKYLDEQAKSKKKMPY